MAENPAIPGKTPKRAAVIVTEYTFNSHADVILGRLLGDFEYTPRIEVAAIYTDQVPENDMSRERAASRGVPIYATIEETLTRAHADGGLDGVIIIGEHGDYPEDQYGRKWYPRRRFFEEVLRVLESLNETTIPIFSDKHFTYNIEDTVWMYNEILKRNHPFMGGSSIPHAPQLPALDPKDLTEASEWLVVSFSSQTEKYGFHALEVLQSLAEKRAGNNLGVKSILALQGDDVWDAMDRKEWPEDLMMSALALFGKADSAHPRHSDEKTVLFIVHYANGSRGYVIQQNNWIDRWGFACRCHSGEIHSAVRMSDLERPFGHFETLTKMIEDFIISGVEPFPAQRTFFTSGMINYAMESLYERKRIETTELLV